MGFSRSIGLACCLGALLCWPAPVQADDESRRPGADERASLSANSVPPARVAPVEVKLPRLGIQAAVLPVGEEPDGAMAAPADPDTVAWWSLGYGTGEPGNLVLAGHVDWGQQPRVFSRLYLLEPGDEVFVVDELAREYRYRVLWLRQVAAESANVGEIFAGSDRSELTLITCGGQFDPTEQMYVDRLIVRAEKL
jgi:LPXTG-site transpeptidase (sortase) family protein